MAIDYGRIKQAALNNAESLLTQLFPLGYIQGHEYRIGNLQGELHGSGSLHIDMETGLWHDFANDNKGGDLIDLWAKARGISNSQAAMQINDVIGAGGVENANNAPKPKRKEDGK